MTDNMTCPLCGAILIPRYEFIPVYAPDDHIMVIRHICPDCIPPEAN